MTTTTILLAAAATLATTTTVHATDHTLGEGIVTAAYVKQHYPCRPTKGDTREYDNVVEKILTVYADGSAAVTRKLKYHDKPATWRNVGSFTSYHVKQ